MKKLIKSLKKKPAKEKILAACSRCHIVYDVTAHKEARSNLCFCCVCTKTFLI